MSPLDNWCEKKIRPSRIFPHFFPNLVASMFHCYKLMCYSPPLSDKKKIHTPFQATEKLLAPPLPPVIGSFAQKTVRPSKRETIRLSQIRLDLLAPRDQLPTLQLICWRLLDSYNEMCTPMFLWLTVQTCGLHSADKCSFDLGVQRPRNRVTIQSVLSTFLCVRLFATPKLPLDFRKISRKNLQSDTKNLIKSRKNLQSDTNTDFWSSRKILQSDQKY